MVVWIRGFPTRVVSENQVNGCSKRIGQEEDHMNIGAKRAQAVMKRGNQSGQGQEHVDNLCNSLTSLANNSYRLCYFFL